MASPDITFDVGCGWLHSADQNSFVKIAEELNFEINLLAMDDPSRQSLLDLLDADAVLTLAVVIGAGPLSTASPETISLPLAFAAGAVIASLADTLMPEAYEHGGPAVALSTTAGFALSFALSLA